MDFTYLSTYLKQRSKDWYKGLSGHVLVIGGEAGYIGAPRMAGEAALRVGAGLVSIATKKGHAAIMNVACPEIMCHGVTEPEQLDPLLQKATVIVLGPGLGQTAWSQKIWEYAIQSSLPKVIDADGLNFLSQYPRKSSQWVLTPHVGEASRLLQQSTEMIQKDRLSAVIQLQKQYDGVAVLKGAGTLVADGHTAPALCDRGNPGMATAGMGDILSGVIGSLIAQGLSLKEAAQLGVYLHAAAGDSVAKDGERGMVATDLLPLLRHLVNEAVQRGCA